MQNKSPEGVDQVSANKGDESQLVEMPQRLSNDYFKYRLWISFLFNIIGWTLTTGLIYGLVLVQSLLQLYFGPYRNEPEIYGELLFLIIVYVIPMFTCIRLHKQWLKQYFESYQWEIIGDTLRIQEGGSTRKVTRILLSKIQSTSIVQGYWERKYGWFKVMILTRGMSSGSNDPLPHIAACIRGCREPHIIQELIENGIRECNTQAGYKK